MNLNCVTCIYVFLNDSSFINFLIFGSFGIYAKEQMQSLIVCHVSLLSLSLSSEDSTPVRMFDHRNFISHKCIHAPATCT